ncbi:MAG: hypothetical protein K2F81_09040, partial [Ruminococcus sp.]|nr:hypothetical protein [Ruminococcus sp.]
MKFKNLLASVTAGILALSGTIFIPMNNIVRAEGDFISKELLTIDNYSSDQVIYLDMDNDLKNGDNYIQVSYIGNYNNSDDTCVQFSNMVPKKNGSGDLARGNFTVDTGKSEYGQNVSKRFLLSDLLNKAVHTSTTGIKGESAVNDITKIRITLLTMNSIPRATNVKIELLKPNENPTPVIDCTVKYQLRGNYDARFIG